MVTGARLSHSTTTQPADLAEAEAMRKNLKNLFNSDFKGDAVEQMLLAAGVMDDWLWNPCKEEKVIHVDDLKDTWSQREKGKAEALAQLEEVERVAKRAKVEQDNKAALSQEMKDRVLANRAKALAQKAAMEQARQERARASASVSDFKKSLAEEKSTKAEDKVRVPAVLLPRVVPSRAKGWHSARTAAAHCGALVPAWCRSSRAMSAT